MFFWHGWRTEMDERASLQPPDNPSCCHMQNCKKNKHYSLIICEHAVIQFVLDKHQNLQVVNDFGKSFFFKTGLCSLCWLKFKHFICLEKAESALKTKPDMARQTKCGDQGDISRKSHLSAEWEHPLRVWTENTSCWAAHLSQLMDNLLLLGSETNVYWDQHLHVYSPKLCLNIFL